MLELDMNVLLVLSGMAAVTYLTRITGYWLTGLWTPKGRMLAAMEILPGGVLLSIVAPVVFATGIAESVAALATVAITLKTGRYFLGVCTGLLCVFILRSFML